MQLATMPLDRVPVASLDLENTGLRAQIGGRLILGYNIGFDLAVLEAEAERHGVEWSWNAALCLRQLATCLLGTKTMMMLGDLEALATHCQVPVVDRRPCRAT